MKNTVPLILALFSLFSISFCLDSSSSSVECEYECMPEHNLTVERSLEAEGSWEFIDEIEIRDEDNNVLCAKDTSINISGGDSETVLSCAAEIPDMDEGDWDFKSCYIVDTANASDDEQCFSETVSVKEWDCEENSECNADEHCYYNSCENLDCEECEYADNHICNPYECCSNSDCDSGEKCVTNECVEVECTRDSECGAMQICRDYQCDNVDCKVSSHCEDDEICSLEIFDCVELDCGTGLIASNHECIHPECTSDPGCPANSVCTENACVPLNCSDGAALNHTCVPFDCQNDSDCLSNEGCRSGFCQALECTGGRVAAFHQCSECDSDSDCTDTQYCPSGTCVAVSCPGGEVFSHICIPSGPGSEAPVGGSGEEENVPREKPFCPGGFILLALLACACFSFAQRGR